MELHAKKDIENISLEILKGSKSIDVFPTPVDKIMQYAELTLADGGMDLKALEKKHKTFVITEALRSGWSKVRGFLDRSEKIIYVDLNQNESRQSFVKLHETGHSVLPWQKKILQFLDDDDTLDPDIDAEFEAEANYFASITLFQNDRFLKEVQKHELGIPAAMVVSKHFGASIHATLRRYVEKSNKRCALLVLKNMSKKGELVNADFRNAFHSDKFLQDFGGVQWPEKFGYKWDFVKPCHFGIRHKLNGEISLNTESGTQNFNYHLFNNTFNAFILFFPQGENKKTNTKIILQG